MKLELHFLQSFPPSCLNRDDTGTPKDCSFGGVRRARVSSQCWKRAIRESFAAREVIPAPERSLRTRRVVDFVTDRLVALGHPHEEAERATVAALAAASLGVDDRTGATQYLLFLPAAAMEALAELLHARWEDLAAARASSARAKKGSPLDAELATAIRARLAGARLAPEIALFGRMVADNRDWNVAAACQVAHALSTHATAVEFDFFTAVDDLVPAGAGGAGMMGHAGFQSACLYRYLLLDIDQLAVNLLGPGEPATPEGNARVRELVASFTEAAILAMPSGRRHGMAAPTLPLFGLAVLRDSGPALSLANAFVRPVAPRWHGHHDDLVEGSIAALDRHFGDLRALYGAQGVRLTAWFALEGAVARGLSYLGGRAIDEARAGGPAVARATDVAAFVSAVAQELEP